MDCKDMVDIILKHSSSTSWIKCKEGYGKGYVFENDERVSLEELYDKCILCYENNTLDWYLEKLNGNFTLVVVIHEAVFLISDKLRSFPLLYFKNSQGIYTITDDVQTVLNNIDIVEFDDFAETEFLSLGYLTGNKTLIKGCNIVPAGCYVKVDHIDVLNCYYTFIHEKKHSILESDILNLSELAVENGFKRILKTTEGKTLVIPLSGGYDSRLIACLCKKYKLTDIICYTYGKTGSCESEISKKVAEVLGFRWYFVEYTIDKWKQFIYSEQFDKYFLFAGNLNSIPHIQDFIAVKELNQKGVIPHDAVFLPGHTGDVIGGSQIPVSFCNGSLENIIFDRYYCLNPLKNSCKNNVLKDLRNSLQEIDSSIEIGFEENDLYDLYNAWGIKTRQSGFIINSVRIYEFFGYGWRIPLWDDDFERLWNSIPWDMKKGSHLYKKFLFEKYFIKMGVDLESKSECKEKVSLKSRIGKYLSPELKFLIKRLMRQGGILKSDDDSCMFYEAAEILKERINFTDNKFIKFSKTEIMSLKTIYYLSLIRKSKPR